MFSQLTKLYIHLGGINYPCALEFCNDSPDEVIVQKYFSSEEQKDISLIDIPKRKNDYIQGRIAAKKALQSLYKVNDPQIFNIKTGVFGQPIVLSPLKQNFVTEVSITHSHGVAAALAFTNEIPMGIDIEKIDPIKINNIKNRLSKQEYEIISAAPSIEEGIFTLWSAKEALSKALLTGLNASFFLYEINNLKIHDSYIEGSFLHFHQYKFISFIGNGLAFSIVIPKNLAIKFN
jgi:phosphopantetheinyl transferase